MKITLLITFSLLAVCSQSFAQVKKKTPPKKPIVKAQDITKTQGQLQGGDGVFGTTYTLNSGINFAVLKARYTLDPHNSYGTVFPKPEEKLLILTCAAKNANSSDSYFPGVELQAIDDEGHDYPSSDYRLASTGSKEFGPSLKPGQGVGQFPDKDELTVAFAIPNRARIGKIILKSGRKFVKDEAVVRYFIADVAKKEREGAEGNPKNAISPLPDFVKDVSDKVGATALESGIGKIGTGYPSAYYTMTIDSVSVSETEKVKDRLPEEGKAYAIITVTVKNNYTKPIGLFYVGNIFSLKDIDGEKYAADGDFGRRKSKRDEEATPDELAIGETYTFRMFAIVPKDVKLKSLYFGTEAGRRYNLEIAEKK